MNLRIKGLANRQHSASGLSLVEVMIGMTLLGMVMAASIMALPEIRALNYKSDSMRMAYSNLNSELENLRTQTFQQLAAEVTSVSQADSSGDAGGLGGLLSGLLGAGGGETEIADYSQIEHSVTQNGVDYTVLREMRFIDASEKLIESTVTVSWGFNGQTKSVSGRAIFTENGLSDKKFSLAN